MEINFGDRRDHIRIEYEAEVKYSELRPEGQKHMQDYEKVKIKNISKRGICILGTKTVEEESMLEIELYINKRIVKSLGEVKYCKPNSRPGIYEIGVNFVSLKASDIIFLEEFVEENSIKRHDFFERE